MVSKDAVAVGAGGRQLLLGLGQPHILFGVGVVVVGGMFDAGPITKGGNSGVGLGAAMELGEQNRDRLTISGGDFTPGKPLTQQINLGKLAHFKGVVYASLAGCRDRDPGRGFNQRNNL